MSTLHLQRQRKKRTFIRKLRHNANIIEIHNFVNNHFQQLCTQDKNLRESQINIKTKISEECELNRNFSNEIETREIYYAIRTACKNRSPGTDGLSYELNDSFYDIIQKEINLIFNEVFNLQVPTQFGDGIIVLVSQNNSTYNENIESFRPSLNCDYKIFSKIIKNRVEHIIENNKLLTSSQKCSNKHRNVFQALLSIKDKIFSLKHKHKTGKLISFDMEKAFDRVDHTYLYKTIVQKFNLDKTTSIDIGLVSDRIVVDWLDNSCKIKILGILFTNCHRLTIKLNWEATTHKFAQIIRQHKTRELNLQQKVMLANTYLTSKLWYVGSIMTINKYLLGRITL
uniref:Reverse transcriptase domain-containing protein n=1 Tax=Anopheles funestus TaxID=62324 RepID=A0A182S015_ANOFN